MLNRTFLVYTSGLEIVGQRTAFVATDLSAAEAFPTVRARRRRGRPDLKRAAIAVVDFSRKMEVLFLRFDSIPFAVLRGGSDLLKTLRFERWGKGKTSVERSYPKMYEISVLPWRFTNACFLLCTIIRQNTLCTLKLWDNNN